MMATELLRSNDEFNYSQTFSIYQECAKTLILDETAGLHLLIRILDKKQHFHDALDEMLADLIEAAGFYPYLQRERLQLSSPSALIRMGGNASQYVKGRIFHDEQKRVLEFLKAGQNLVVSAPTSFGKSLLIEEMIASKKFRSIVIIQPTLALLDETRRKLVKYRDLYKLIVRTSQNPAADRGNIFLFTAERVNEYADFQGVDFLVVDEFYKLSGHRDDERSDSLNNALMYLLKRFKPQFYLAGPNIDSVSPQFLKRYGATFFATTYNLVGTEDINIFALHAGMFGDRGKKKEFKEKVLFNLLDDLMDEQTIVYCASPSRARSLSCMYLAHMVQSGKEPKNRDKPIYEWISSNVSPLWSLISLMQYGIGFHDGALQRHITSTVIEYFETKVLNILFCTSTIIEGVNTNAKNVVYFDQRKGKDISIDYFDYSNIRGRAGRMMEHYLGKIYNFGHPPEKTTINIDIPFVDQAPVPEEVLINIDDFEVKDKESEHFKYISSLPTREREIFSLNGINIRGQADLLARLRDEISDNYEKICWDRMPTYAQLSYCLGLAWECLLRSDENVSPMSLRWLVNLTFNYGKNQSINQIVQERFEYDRKEPKNSKKSDEVLMDNAIRESFQTMRHWFQYKIPKWLMVIDRLQKFVCEERGLRSGNYVYYATILENDFVRENLSILSEFGVPRSAIIKLAAHISADLDQDNVLSVIAQRRLLALPQLTQYEREKISRALER